MSKTPEELIPALRQYLHNDGSGFVAAYDKEEVDRIFAALKSRVAELDPTPDRVRFYYMHDCHAFESISGSSIDEILAKADKIESVSSYGMLCPAIVLAAGVELRRVGPCVHAGASTAPKDKWEEGKAAWRKAVEGDPDITRLLASVSL